MSAETNPISPARFAEALKDLPISTLHLKALEIRNSIAHLDYSNEQLLPFTEEPEVDQDCVDAIKENEVVIKRMLERIDLLKKEVEERGASWTEFQSAEEVKEAAEGNGEVNGDAQAGNHDAWSDGTFQTGRIVNGEVVMNGTNGTSATNGTNVTSENATNGTGGSLDDDALRRRIEERLRMDAEEDEGMHL